MWDQIELAFILVVFAFVAMQEQRIRNLEGQMLELREPPAGWKFRPKLMMALILIMTALAAGVLNYAIWST